jgi:hypothetical protein
MIENIRSEQVNDVPLLAEVLNVPTSFFFDKDEKPDIEA